MKVAMTHSTTFYIRSALAFFKGVPAKEAIPATEGKDGEKGTKAKEAREAKPAVSELTVSGMGNAINVAIACASRCENEGIGIIENIKTDYVTVKSGPRERSCPQIEIKMKRHPNADKVIAEKIREMEEA